MIVKVAANARQRLQHGNTGSPQLSFIPNAGLHQQLWSVDRS
jgi:hypothetical protein